MKIYKEKQFLIFDFENGQTVKYNFATKESIGKSGKPVKDLCSQLRGLTIQELCDSCTDKQYGKFLRFVRSHGSYGNTPINNIGTILDRVKDFSRFEQIFSAGIEGIVDIHDFHHTINDIPKGLIKLCREHKIKLSDTLLKHYKENPDAYNLACNLEYVSLNDANICNVFTHTHSERTMRHWGYIYISVPTFNKLLNDYGYTTKALMNYIDYLKTYEAIEDISFVMKELIDYVGMMSKISNKFDRYPRHFLTTHKIACRNYNRLKQQFEENKFKSRIDKDMEKTFGEYCFIYPESTQDIKDEAVSQNNCVASYIQRVIDGGCHILFLRKKDSPDQSLVTIEVRDNKIVQARQRFNYPVTSEQQEVIDKWNNWYTKKIKEKESKENMEVAV